MDEKKTELEGNEKDGSKKQGSGNRILLIVALAGVLIFNTIVAFILIKITTPETQEQKLAKIQADSLKKATENATLMGATTEKPIEAIVNIAGTDGDRFLKAAVIFEYDEVAYPELGAELEKRAPKFKDLLIDHLSKLTLLEVMEPDAKDRIRKNLLKLVNNSLPAKIGEIREVFFTTYIIQ
ncbi:MAG: flagellar basal body-associated FliL family protein [Fibrobacter sp.]|nr:flagellar basal body-associated FliL family protein [Fibrobacter sp.]